MQFWVRFQPQNAVFDLRMIAKMHFWVRIQPIIVFLVQIYTKSIFFVLIRDFVLKKYEQEDKIRHFDKKH